jgi:hypothetical protein
MVPRRIRCLRMDSRARCAGRVLTCRWAAAAVPARRTAVVAAVLGCALISAGAAPALASVPKPVNLTVTPGPGSLQLRWQVTTTADLGGFRVRWRPVSPSGEPWEGPVERGATARGYTIRHLAAQPYEVKVRALLAEEGLGGLVQGVGTPLPEELNEQEPTEGSKEEEPTEEPKEEEPKEEAPAGNATGQVRLIKDADSSFDLQDTQANSAWINENFSRMLTYSSWFDKNLGWYTRAMAYDDAYAIYPGSALAKEHPGWIATDALGAKLYIPWGCSGGSCPQYAADISNAAYRAHWISELKSTLAQGYAGVFVDDVDTWANTSNGIGTLLAPIDHNTGLPMTDAVWRSYLAKFMEELRSALPGYEIMQNQVWYKGGGPHNVYVASMLRNADWTMIEHGVTDGGITGGTGEFSLYHLLSYVNEVHALGTAVDIGGDANNIPSMEYTLAGYFLVNDGKDLVQVSDSQGVSNLWPGWKVSLGEAQESWTRAANGLFDRDFSRGVVYLNEPGASTKTITLPAPMLNSSGETVTSVTLGPKTAAVLRTR